MYDRERLLFGFLHDYAHRLTADVPDEHAAAQPAPGMNHPAWVLGHLAVAIDYGLEVLGRPYVAPAAWHDLFAPGTLPLPERATYPPLAELLAGYDAAHAAFGPAAAAADPAILTKPNELGFLQQLPTHGAILAHLLTTHEAIHLGQLSAWRRCVGLPAV